jgi:Gas vesicle synthesis protein GvpL/GvpF
VLSYVFCLIRSDRQPTMRRVSEGMPGGHDLRAIEVGEQLWAVVQSVPEAGYSETALSGGLQNLDWVGPRAIAHERVIESFLSARALLPMPLFTLFTSDDRAVQHVQSDGTRIRRLLKRVEGRVEWGLRLTFDEKAARAKVSNRPVTSGTEFLARKRDVLSINRTRLKEAKGTADRVYKSISRLATAAQRRTSLERAAPGSRLLLDAAFLVPAGKSGAFRSAVRQQTRDLRTAGIAMSLTGPWPAYNFIE